jgi:putative isomerase
MEPKLAEDSLLILTENLRSDGKMGHFICSTWVRPQATQPALVGWAGLRLVKLRNDKELAAKLLKPLCKNAEWWLTQRVTRFGIVSSINPVETGWDDTPRFDKGPVLPCDMNSYVLMQMRACEEFASMTGEKELELQIKKQADAFAKKMIEILYDPGENIFKDVLLETGEQLSLKSPACFIPLLADIPIEKDRAIRMIKDHLLDPKKFFGNVPFPSIAYDEEEYKPEKWWRGPTWIPIAYFMLEVLYKYGFEEEYRIASKRLYNMIIDDGRISELFNSKTGEGLGSKQQGWTAAILLKLRMDADR